MVNLTEVHMHTSLPVSESNHRVDGFGSLNKMYFLKRSIYWCELSGCNTIAVASSEENSETSLCIARTISPTRKQLNSVFASFKVSRMSALSDLDRTYKEESKYFP